MSHADLSVHFVSVDVAAFAVYNCLVIALPASKLAQSNDETVVHVSFNAQMGTVPVVTFLSPKSLPAGTRPTVHLLS